MLIRGRNLYVASQFTRRSLSHLKNPEVDNLRALVHSPNALKAELSRLVNVHLNKKAQTQSLSSSSISKTIMKLSITPASANVPLCMDLLMALMKSDPFIWRYGINDLLEQCIDCDWLDDAMFVVNSVCVPSNIPLDLQLMERLVSALALSGSFADINYLLTLPSTSLSHNMLSSISEPLIMSGQLSAYSEYLGRFIKSRPSSQHLSDVIRSFMLARMRRYVSATEATESEKAGLKCILAALTKYHLTIPGGLESASSLPSYFLTRQLLEMEQETCPDFSISSPESRFFLQFSPKLDLTGFPFVIEERTVPIALRLSDLTAELESIQSNILLLYSKDLFLSSYDYEMKQLKRRSNSAEHLMRGMLLGSLLPKGSDMGREAASHDDDDYDSDGDDADSDDEYDEDSDEDDEDDDDEDGLDNMTVQIVVEPSEGDESTSCAKVMQVSLDDDDALDAFESGYMKEQDEGELEEEMMRLGQAKSRGCGQAKGEFLAGNEDSLEFSRSFFSAQLDNPAVSVCISSSDDLEDDEEDSGGDGGIAHSVNVKDVDDK